MELLEYFHSSRRPSGASILSLWPAPLSSLLARSLGPRFGACTPLGALNKVETMGAPLVLIELALFRAVAGAGPRRADGRHASVSLVYRPAVMGGAGSQECKYLISIERVRLGQQKAGGQPLLTPLSLQVALLLLPLLPLLPLCRRSCWPLGRKWMTRRMGHSRGRPSPERRSDLTPTLASSCNSSSRVVAQPAEGTVAGPIAGRGAKLGAPAPTWPPARVGRSCAFVRLLGATSGSLGPNDAGRPAGRPIFGATGEGRRRDILLQKSFAGGGLSRGLRSMGPRRAIAIMAARRNLAGFPSARAASVSSR